MAARIIDRGRGPEVAGTRVTVYRIVDFLREGSSAGRIATELHLTEEQVRVALDYIAAHRRNCRSRIRKRSLQRVHQRKPPTCRSRPGYVTRRFETADTHSFVCKTSHMLILADNDVGGAVTALRRIFGSEEWAAFSATLALRFAELQTWVWPVMLRIVSFGKRVRRWGQC